MPSTDVPCSALAAFTRSTVRSVLRGLAFSAWIAGTAVPCQQVIDGIDHVAPARPWWRSEARRGIQEIDAFVRQRPAGLNLDL